MQYKSDEIEVNTIALQKNIINFRIALLNIPFPEHYSFKYIVFTRNITFFDRNLILSYKHIENDLYGLALPGFLYA